MPRGTAPVEAVVGLGGFVTGPGGVAAWLMRRPLIIHEQNAVAGFTNRCLSHIADEVLEAFPDSFSRAVRFSSFAERVLWAMGGLLCPVIIPNTGVHCNGALIHRYGAFPALTAA